MRLLSFNTGLILILYLSRFTYSWYDGDKCCALAKAESKFLDISPKDVVCGQSYHLLSNGTPVAPAPHAYVSYSFCHARCPGWGRSKANVPTQWAAPIVQFLLPSVIFAMTTPRTREMELRHSWIYTKAIVRLTAYLHRPLAWMNEMVADLVSWMFQAIIAEFLVVIVDTVVWISTIVMLAGPMLVEGLFEALLDFRILRFVRTQPFDVQTASHCPRTQLLLTIVSGNLALDIAEPQKKILEALGRSDMPSAREAAVKTRLLSMIGSQSIFGAAVGAPVLFYLGAFVYTILDLEDSPSSQDAAIPLAFGIEWMIVVHVAIVAGCLLANNNPSTSSAIVGLLPEEVSRTARMNSEDTHLRPGDLRIANNGSEPQIHHEAQNLATFRSRTLIELGLESCVEILRRLTGWNEVYETLFQPVPMWLRGSNKMKWLRETQAWKTCYDGQGIGKSVGILTWYWLFLPTFVFVMLPAIAGAVVAYATPPVGFGCRSLSFICYAGCQFILTVRATMKLDAQSGSLWSWLRWLSQPWGWAVRLYGLTNSISFWLLSFLPKIFRTCLLFFVIWLPFNFVPLVGSLFTAVGGTLMQVMGVYRTCFCYVNAPWWLHLDVSPGVDVASDTEAARVSSRHWLQAGIVATGFMAVVCYLGRAYQESLKHLFREEVMRLCIDIGGDHHKSDEQQEEEGRCRIPDLALLPPLMPQTELRASRMFSADEIF